ncbi:MAG: GTPase HflX [Desulfobacteraceae bacterium]|nr:GTPase HflX [Desulfobacteraceae bacterium]
MKQIWGQTKGLKASQLNRLEKLYRRRVPPEFLITPEVAKELAELSFEIQCQIGLIINRAGKIEYVLVGDHQSILIPELSDYRSGPGRLRGVRCIHTHLDGEPLNQDDFTDLSLLRLDLMAAIGINAQGLPQEVHWAHILPKAVAGQTPYEIQASLAPHQLAIQCDEIIRALEQEMGQFRTPRHREGVERALLISVTNAPRKKALNSLAELDELCISGGIEVVDSVLQLRKEIDPRTLIGSGKLQELAIRALQQEVSLIVFDQDLNPSQIRSIADQIALKVIDRTQLILDIFAQRARSKEGKLQVELAQLKYLLPRLVTKNTAMSRLTGGIGGRGPGETKLEINRRRVRDRIHRLEKELEQVQKHRQTRRRQREQKGVPIISIIGYTNAGKSTLLNTLTHSRVLAESRMFATLDPSSRRLRFPRDMEVLITDTVGFIRDLPKDLVVAFRATLEELESADLLLHVIDISNPRHDEQIQAVEAILEDLDLDGIPRLRALNKKDLLPPDMISQFAERLEGVAICARDRSTLTPLIERMAHLIERTGSNQ